MLTVLYDVFCHDSLVRDRRRGVALPYRQDPVGRKNVSVRERVAIRILVYLGELVRDTRERDRPRVHRLRQVVATVGGVGLPICFFSFGDGDLMGARVQEGLPRCLCLVQDVQRCLEDGVDREGDVALPSCFVDRARVTRVFPIICVVPGVTHALGGRQARASLVQASFRL